MGVIDPLISLGDRINTRFGTTSDPVAEHLDIGTDEPVAISRLSTPDSAEPRPLVLALHGFGSDERQMETLVPLQHCGPHVHRIAVRGGWRIDDGGFAWFPITGTSPTDVAADPAQVDEAADRLAAVIHALTASPEIDANNVWIVGYSQGAPTALHLLQRHPGVVRGVAIGAGAFVTEPDPTVDLDGNECFVAISSNDPFVTADDHADTVRRLRASGATVETHEDTVPHVISAKQADAIDRWLATQI